MPVELGPPPVVRPEPSHPLWRAVALDLRSLALFRIVLGTALVVAFPRTVVEAIALAPALAPLLALTVVAGAWLITGWRSRLAAWVATISLGALASDTPSTLLWLAVPVVATFLPLGARASIDHALDSSRDRAPARYASLATLAWCALAAGIGVQLAATAGSTTTSILTLAVVVLSLSPLHTDIARLVALAVLVVLCVLTPGVAWVVPFWLPFVPTALWNTLVRAVAARPSRQNVRIVYDGDCGFCQAGAHIVRVLCAFPLDAVKSANTDADLLADMTARDSWILVLPDGSRRYRFAAVIHLLSITPWWWPVSMVLRIPPLPWLGDRWYRHIARNRLAISRRARWLVTFRPYTADALPRSLRWAPLAIALTALFWMAVARLQ